jgi:putative nucleotidyltransferase with HDIG domain
LVDEWTFVLSQSKGYVLKPMSDFKKIFPAIVLLSLWVVLILSIYNIRKSLVPLEILKKGTCQMADQVAVSLSNATLMEELDQLGWGAINALARTVDAKSSWTAGHSIRVTEMALKIGSELGISSKKLEDLHRAALLHDIGKVGIPLSVLDKPGALNDDEFAMIKKHPTIGARILEPIESYADIIPIVLQHHERFDGKGYPGGISGNEIDIGARILSVADVYDALVSDRPYRKGWSVENVIDYIRRESGSQFDPDVAEIFWTMMRQKKTMAA